MKSALKTIVVDFHTHLQPKWASDRIRSGMARSQHPRAKYFKTMDLSPAGLLASQRSAGIDVSVVLPVVTPSKYPNVTRNWVSSRLTWLHKLINSTSGLVGFGALHPDMEMEDIEHAVGRIVKYGWRGVKFHSPQQQFDPASLKMYEIFSLLAENGLIVLMDTVQDPKRWPIEHSLNPERLMRIVKDHPTLKVVGAHMAGYFWWGGERIFSVLEPAENLYLDTSSSFFMSEEHLRRFIDVLGIDNILFGSDFPYSSQASEIERMGIFSLDDHESAAVMGANAARLLGL